MCSLQAQQQVEELQHAMALTKAAVAQLRADADAERSERWRVDSERNQWIADLRTAVAKTDASVDAKLAFHVERLTSRLTVDRMDTMRLLEEHRELVTGADLKRISSQTLELSRMSDHVLALERWVHTEFGHIKRVFHYVLADTDERLEAVACELATSVTRQSERLFHLDDELSARLCDLHDAVLDVAYTMQKKLSALEAVVPMEVTARQQHADGLCRRIDSVVTALSTVRDECVVSQTQLQARVTVVEDAQRETVDGVNAAHGTVNKMIRAFVQDSDAMLARLGVSVRATRLVPVGGSGVAEANDSNEALQLHDEMERSESNPTVVALEVTVARPEWLAYCEGQLRDALLSDVDQKLAVLAAQMDATRALVEQQSRAEVESLRAWTASHAVECGQCYEYLTWAVEGWKMDDAVARCLTAVVDRVADEAVLEEFQALEDATSWAVEQVVASRPQEPLLPVSTEPTNSVRPGPDDDDRRDPALWL